MAYLGSVPLKKEEDKKISELFNSICQIYFEKKMGIGTGFFLQVNIQDFPFNKCLLTNNHVLNIEETSIGNEITLKIKNNEKIIKITKDRRVFTDYDLDYTCIEILPNDNIKHFFQIDSQILGNGINTLPGKEIILLNYFNEEHYISSSKITNIDNKYFFHNCNSKSGNCGAPTINKSSLSIIGIHVGFIHRFRDILKKEKPIKLIIDNIKKNNIINNLNIITSISYKKRFKNLVLIGKGNFGTVYKEKKKEEKKIYLIYLK